MRLGAQETPIEEGTVLMDAYNEKLAFERHRHRYEVNLERFPDLFRNPGEKDENRLTISSLATFVEAIELPEKRFFLGIQYHPEFRSKVGNPNPVFELFVKRVREKRRNQ